MKTRKILTMFLFIVLASFSFEAWAGPLVWGPKKYMRETGTPIPVIENFTIDKPKGKFWLQVSNGGSVRKPGEKPLREPVNQVSSAYIMINGVQVLSPRDLNQNVYGFTKDITLQANNTIEVEVRGKPESYITVEIRKAELNVNIDNTKRDLSGLNMKEQIVLWWSREQNASEYIIYKAYSIYGPWSEWTHITVSPDARTNAVDGTSEAQTRDLCYRIEALDSKGKVIKKYEPICVPKWQEEESSLPLTVNESPSDTVVTKLSNETFMLQSSTKGDENHPSLSSSPLMGEEIIKNPSPLWGEGWGEGEFSGQRFGKTCFGGRDSPSFQVAELSLADRFQLTDTPMPLFSNPALFLEPSNLQLALNTSTQSSTQSSLPPYDKINKMCLTNDEFIDATTMNYEDIKKFLKDKGSFLQGDEVEDVNGVIFDPAEIIDFAAQTYRINPHVILTLLQRENSAVTAQNRLEDKKLKLIMNYNTSNPTTISDQIMDGTAQMRRNFDKLSNGQPTINGWQVGVGKNAIDGRKLLVTPSNKAVAASFSYDPEVGQGWDKTSTAGGNALFCDVWDQWNFGTPCPSEPATLTLSGLDAPSNNTQYTVTGGTPPYTWSITEGKGTITPSGDGTTATVSNITNQCGSATITVKDSCGNKATKDVKMPSGKWVTIETVYWHQCTTYYGNWFITYSSFNPSSRIYIANISSSSRYRYIGGNGVYTFITLDYGVTTSTNCFSLLTVIPCCVEYTNEEFIYDYIYSREYQQWSCP